MLVSSRCFLLIDCAPDAESGDTVRSTASVTDDTVDDPDSSHCVHANSVLRADRDSAAADVTAALLQSHVMLLIHSPEICVKDGRLARDYRQLCSQ